MVALHRIVIFAQFVETGSFIHRMDARIKIAATSVLIVASFLIDDFSGFAVMLPLLVVIRTEGLADLPRVPGLYPSFSGSLLS